MSSTKKINLKSRDGDVFEIEEAVALKSQTIKHMIEDNCADDSGIPLPNVTGQILAKVIEYCKKHVEAENSEEKPAEKPVEAENSEEKPADDDGHVDVANSEKKPSEGDGLKAWDTEFVKVDQVTLFELLLAANYLDINSLQELACKTIAEIMVGKTVEEIRKMFNIVNDYTKEEEEEVRREHQWAFE